MCGIVGYTGHQKAVDVLLDALSSLEYRGYDSAGISIFEGTKIDTIKSLGRLDQLRERIDSQKKVFSGTCGIGHTRWATHGEPSDVNAHPHTTKKLSLVHNGIIENYVQIRQKLQADGYKFVSRTDTETAAHLLDRLYTGDPMGAIRQLCSFLEGSYAFAVLFWDHPGEVYGVCKGCPLIAAKGKEENFLVSDIPAILPYTRDYVLLEEGDLVKITADSILIQDSEGKEKIPKVPQAQPNMVHAQNGGYPHFMLKEIYEQPKALRDTIHPRIVDGLPDFAIEDSIPDGFWRQFDRISIVACGTAWHAGMLGKGLIERLARIPVECEIASEFRYRSPLLDRRTLVILISQSGETADTLAALRLARESGSTTLAVVNVTGSTIAREADYIIHTFAGPEIAVASTKAFSVQLAVMYLIAIKLALAGGRCQPDEARSLIHNLLEAIEATLKVFDLDSAIQKYAQSYVELKDLFFLGRGLDYSLAMEGSLKLKEISYIHCEAYAAGELKHGTISLITPGTPVIALATQDALLSKTLSNVREVISRGAEILLLCKDTFTPESELAGKCILLPALDDLFMPFVGVIALQLLAYHTAVFRDCDVDKPRNLAKSVTVE